MTRDRGPVALTAAAPVGKAPKYNSLVAAASVILSPTTRSAGAMAPFKTANWQKQAWDFYDTVGELGFGITWLANGMSRVNLVAARPPTGPGDDPTPLHDTDEDLTAGQKRAIQLVAAIANGPSGQGEMLAAFGTHLPLVGICWLVAEPSLLDPASDQYETWNVYSADQLRQPNGAPTRTLDDGSEIPVIEVEEDGEGKWRPLHPNALLVKAWRKHPRKSYLPTAPTSRSLSILALIDALTKRQHAEALSRLAGAGLLLLPTEATFPPGQAKALQLSGAAAGEEADDEVDVPVEDDFAETFTEYSTIPIADRASPAAVVPLVARIPGDYVDKVKHISFSTPLDERLGDALDRAIRRLALSMDLPAQVLLGMDDVNHWTAWQVAESAVTLHIEPTAETAVNALTVGYLSPALSVEGYDPSEAMVWYDTGDLTDKPDNSANATAAYDRGAISEEGFLLQTNLPLDLMPNEAERKRQTLLRMAEHNPHLAIAVLTELGYLSPENAQLAVAESVPSNPTAAPPGQDDNPPPPPAPETGPPPTKDEAPAAVEAQVAALMAAADQIVIQALRGAGNRLRSAAGRKVTGGAASIQTDDPTTLHCRLDPTVYSDLDQLLAGAWTGVPAVAARLGFDSDALRTNLNAYTRALLASQQEHSYDRLGHALGVHAAIVPV